MTETNKDLWIFLRALQKQKHFPSIYAEITSLLVQSRENLQNVDLLKEALLSTTMGRRLGTDDFQRSLEFEANKLSSLPSSIRLCHLLDPLYPASFLKTTFPPWTFQYCGSLQETVGRFCLGVVGSREPTRLTQDWMESEFFSFLKLVPQLQIVSGGARGVDQMAHHLAVVAGKKTLVWLPSGLGEIYPEHFKEMAQQILSKGGVLLSEFDYNESMRKHHFVERNRLIAGMSQSLLIPQASLRSGTMMTAHFALELGRPLFVVPGHPLISAYGGNLELVQLGASFVRSSRDLQQFLTFEIEEHGKCIDYS